MTKCSLDPGHMFSLWDSPALPIANGSMLPAAEKNQLAVMDGSPRPSKRMPSISGLDCVPEPPQPIPTPRGILLLHQMDQKMLTHQPSEIFEGESGRLCSLRMDDVASSHMSHLKDERFGLSQ